MSLYGVVLVLHSIVRWAVVIFAVWAAVRAILGWTGNRPWSALDRQVGLLFGMSLDIQVLIGLVLYFLVSPLTSPFYGASLSNPNTSHFTWEHFVPMLIALALAHVGSSRARKAAGDLSKHRTAAVFYTLAFLVILLAIPWPFLPYGRPWIRL